MAFEKRNKRIEVVLIKSEAMNTGNAILILHTNKVRIKMNILRKQPITSGYDIIYFNFNA